MRSPSRIGIALVLTSAIGCTTQHVVTSPASSKTSPLGASKESAIEVCRPAGQRAYLDRLQCADGSPVTYRRVGSFGARTELPQNLSDKEQAALLDKAIRGTPLQPGEPDHHVVDGYEVSCGQAKRIVYMDMYHCDRPATTEVPAGFTVRSSRT